MKKACRYLWNPKVIESPDTPGLKENNIVVAFADFKHAYQIVYRPGVKLLRDPYTGKPYVNLSWTQGVGLRAYFPRDRGFIGVEDISQEPCEEVCQEIVW